MKGVEVTPYASTEAAMTNGEISQTGVDDSHTNSNRLCNDTPTSNRERHGQTLHGTSLHLLANLLTQQGNGTSKETRSCGVSLSGLAMDIGSA